MACCYDDHDPNNFQRQAWAVVDYDSYSLSVLELPFPISLGAMKDIITTSLHMMDDNQYIKEVGGMFNEKMSALAKKQRATLWESENCTIPEAANLLPTSSPFQQFFPRDIGVSNNEIAVWTEKQIFIQDNSRSFHFGAYLRPEDLDELESKSSPATLNLVDIVISLLNGGTVDDETFYADQTSVKNSRITTFPLSFTKTLLECGHKMGRPGIARFVQVAVNNGYLQFYFQKDKTQVILFPFQSVFSDNMYLGILLTHNIDDDFKPQFLLLRYGELIQPMQAEFTYISIINDFVNMLVGHFFHDNHDHIGKSLHMVGNYISPIQSSRKKLVSIISRPYDRENGDDHKQTNWLVEDILFFYTTTPSATMLDELSASWKTSSLPFGPVLQGFVMAAKRLIPFFSQRFSSM